MKKLITCIALALLLSRCQTITEPTMKQDANSVLLLQARMRTDPVFQLYEKSFRKNLQIALANREVNQRLDKNILKAGMESVKTQKDYYSLLEKAGIKNPEEQMLAHKEFLEAEAKLLDKYPEIKKLDRKGFNLLMSEANKVDGALMKSILRPKTSNN